MTIAVQKFQQATEEQQPLTDNAPENNVEGTENVEEIKQEQSVPVDTAEQNEASVAEQNEGSAAQQIEATKPENNQENEVKNENEEAKGQDENNLEDQKEA